MKKLLLILLCLPMIGFGQETKTIQIYENFLTHTNIKANISYLNGNISNEDVYYTVTYKAMWTGKLKTMVVYSGNLTETSDFLSSVLQFSELNKDSIGSSMIFEGRNISIAKVFGFKVTTIKYGDEGIHTNFKSIKQASEALDEWIKENKTLN